MKIYPTKFSIEDVAKRVEWINDSRINNHMFFELPATVEKTEKWFLNNVGNKSRVDFTFKDSEGEQVAMGGFTGVTSDHKNAEFYIMVNPDMHGKGIGWESSIWMYNYAFSVLGLHKIFLYTNDNNKAAYSIYEKAGFSLEGVLREHKWKNNEFQNRRFYGLLRSEWENISWKSDIKDNEF